MYFLSTRLNSFTISYNLSKRDDYFTSILSSASIDIEKNVSNMMNDSFFISSHSVSEGYRGQNLPSMRSITQLTGVALTLVQRHIPNPCKSSMTDLMSGNCT